MGWLQWILGPRPLRGSTADCGAHREHSWLQSLGRIDQGKTAAELGWMRKKYAEMGWGTAGENYLKTDLFRHPLAPIGACMDKLKWIEEEKVFRFFMHF